MKLLVLLILVCFSTNMFHFKAVVDSRLRPRCAICCRCIRRQSPTAWRHRKFVTTCCSTAPT